MPVESAVMSLQAVGSYDLLELIAEGGMGAVYRGRHRASGATVAVKVLSAHMLSNPVHVRRFEQEYNVARAVDHPNIVKALDFGHDGTAPYLVLEFVEGESLGAKIDRLGPMSEAAALALIGQIADGLDTAHQLGLIHRDVKPDNILVTPEGVAKLTDLGLAKGIDADQNLTRTGRGLGTPHFMAPEQFRNAKKADARCDVYSLAATLYILVTGELPFKSNGPLDAWMKKVSNQLVPPRDLMPSLSDAMESAIRRGMSPEPSQRPTSCRALVEEATHAAGPQPVSATPAAVAPTADRWFVLDAEEGDASAVEATTETIRQALREGRLQADALHVAHTPAGPFEPIATVAAFRDLFGAPASALPPQPAPAPAPDIHLNAAPADGGWDVWKWVAIVMLSASLGILGYTALPLLPLLPRLF